MKSTLATLCLIIILSATHRGGDTRNGEPNREPSQPTKVIQVI